MYIIRIIGDLDITQKKLLIRYKNIYYFYILLITFYELYIGGEKNKLLSPKLVMFFWKIVLGVIRPTLLCLNNAGDDSFVNLLDKKFKRSPWEFYKK